MAETGTAEHVGRRDSNTTVCAFVVAVIALGQAVQSNNGALDPTAFRYLNVAMGACLLGVLLPALGPIERSGARWLTLLAAVGAAWQFATLLSNPLAIYIGSVAPAEVKYAHELLAASAVLGGLALVRQPRYRGRWVPLLVVPHFLLGVWILRASPLPHIDVFVFQRDGSEALLHGVNPYTLTFPNIYGDGSSFYGPNMSINGRLQFGFPYPPLSLFLSVVGHLFGDFRYAQLAAMDGAALFMAYARRGRAGPIAALLYLFTPRGFFVLEQGWTEPYLVLLLSFAVFCACRAPKLLAAALGLFVAVKQYLVLAVLPLLMLSAELTPRRLIRFYGMVGATAAIVTLPLALWNFKAFWWDVVALQVFQPFRSDALSYLAWWAQGTPATPGSWIAFAAAAAATAIALWRLPRTPAGFSGSITLVFAAFFAFNKQAFCNYYFFVIGALSVSIAAKEA